MFTQDQFQMDPKLDLLMCHLGVIGIMMMMMMMRNMIHTLLHTLF